MIFTYLHCNSIWTEIQISLATSDLLKGVIKMCIEDLFSERQLAGRVFSIFFEIGCELFVWNVMIRVHTTHRNTLNSRGCSVWTARNLSGIYLVSSRCNWFFFSFFLKQSIPFLQRELVHAYKQTWFGYTICKFSLVRSVLANQTTEQQAVQDNTYSSLVLQWALLCLFSWSSL